jgi:cob(I)alamin adenosyltransferase
MAPDSNQTTSPSRQPSSSEQGGASQAQALQWIQLELNKISHSMGRLEASQQAQSESMNRIEGRATSVDSELQGLKQKLAWVAGGVAGAVAIFIFIFGSDLKTIWASLLKFSSM